MSASIFSSPEHKVLRVSYCDRPLSVVRRASSVNFFKHSKNGGGALSVTPVRAALRSCVRLLSKFGVRSITFERLL